MRFSALALCAGAAAAWPAPAISSASSLDIVVETAQPATRLVRTTHADFASATGLSGLKSRIRSAARAACHDQYRGEMLLVVRSCSKAAADDALGKLDRLIARSSGAAALAGSVIAVRAK